MPIEDPVARLLAYEEIRQLASRYAVAVDRRDIDGLVALFVDDVRTGRDTSGRDSLRAQFETSLADIGLSILNVGTHQIDLIDDDHASGHVYTKCEVHDHGDWIHQAIRYDDTYERRGGKWYFTRRRHLLFYGAIMDWDPTALPPANWPERQYGLGSIPHDDPTWSTFWGGRRPPG